MKRVLLTGGAGFIGSHMVEHILKNTRWTVVLLDKLDLSGNLNRLKDIRDFDKYKENVTWVWHDLRSPIEWVTFNKIGQVDCIIHLGAATHVDRSISDPIGFVLDNVVGTTNLLEFARKQGNPNFRFIYFSTDEVFGPAPSGVAYREWDRYNSGNPYAATKAGAEELCLAYANTYGLNVSISHCMNVFGERQHPEKFIPSTIRKVLDGETVYVHADKTKTISGSRFYIHARNVADATLFILKNGQKGDKYNIVGEREVSNLGLASMIANIIGKDLKYELVDFHSSRPGHDLRYALNGSKMADMGWKPPVDFDESLQKTVLWTLQHKEWLRS